jgi:hypothetical protein
MLASMAVWSAPVRAAPYQFEFLAERPRSTHPLFSSVYKLPALNDNGTVALLLPRSASGPLEEVIYTGTPGNLSEVGTPGVGVLGGVSINNPGRIGFVGSKVSVGQGVYSVSPGGPLVTIEDSAFFYGRLETAISDSGAVMATTEPPLGYPTIYPGSVLIGDGSSPVQVAASTRSPVPNVPTQSALMFRPRMNASGAWAASETGSTTGFPYTTVHTSDRTFSFFGPYDGATTRYYGPADVADNGVFLYSGFTLPGGVRSLYTFTAGVPSSVLVAGSTGLGDLAAINNDGVVAVLEGPSEIAGTTLRLLRGGVSETVLAQGDALLGSTVSTIGFDPKGFNNASQFALLVGLADGRDVYVLASPVPEPAGVAVMTAVVGLLALRRRRR